MVFKLFESGVITPGEETKAYVADFIKASSLQKVSCNWAGYTKQKSTNHQQVFVACVPQEKIPTEINSKNDLQNAIAKYVIAPAINTLPMDDNLSIVGITKVQENSVICTEIVKRKIIRQWDDSYENYCMPP